MDGAIHPPRGVPLPVSQDRGASRPAFWPGFLLGLASTSIAIGVIWDISWHSTIGRDTFWTPAHMAIYLGGVLGGCVGGWMAVKHTFFSGEGTGLGAVSILGARAPVGAWIAIWGAIAMITSAPFDDWWHNAYGLDVKILSPPHVVLGLGMFAISIGAVLLGAAQRNCRGDGAGDGLFLYAGGVFVTLGAIFVTEFSAPNLQHAARFYKVCGTVFAFRLIALGYAARVPWAATKVAGIYLGIECLMIWILPLFPAQPKLAPIFNPVTHMVPPQFPLLLIPPAMAIDLILARAGEINGAWRRLGWAAALTAGFLGVFIAVQWYFSEFLISPRANNWFFAGNRFWSYGAGLNSYRTQFWYVDPSKPEADLFNFRAVLLTGFWTWLGAWIGLAWGGWMRKVTR